MDRCILHVDLNCCFAQIECEFNPELREKPVVVAGKEELRHGIVMAKNEVAKKCGIKTACTLREARNICPSVVVLPPNYDRYKLVSAHTRKIYYDYSDLVEPFGIDECWIDVTNTRRALGMSGSEIARKVNARVKEELGLTTSVGVSWNKIFAKFGSDYKKPDAITEITRENYKSLVWESPVRDLLYVGRATEKKLNAAGIFSIGQLASASDVFLNDELGKMGFVLREFARGEDISEVKEMDPDAIDVEREIKSYGNGVTFPRDIDDDKTAKAVTHMLAESVSQRMRKDGARAKKVSIGIRNNLDLGIITRQKKLDVASNITIEICDAAWDLMKNNWKFTKETPVRAIQVQAGDIETDQEFYQMFAFDKFNQRDKLENLDKKVDEMRRRYGNNAIMWGAKATDKDTVDMDIVGWDKPHPVSFFHR